MHSASSVPTTRENEQSDEEVQEADNAKIIFNGSWFFSRLGYQLSLELAAGPLKLVMCFRPQPGAPQALGDVDSTMNFRAVDSENVIASPDPSIGGRRIWGDVPGQHPARSVPPGYAVVR